MYNTVKFFFGIFLQFLLVIAVFWVGWHASFISIDLNNVGQTSGIIASVSTQQSRGSKAIPGQMDLIIRLSGVENGFWIYRSSQEYSELISKMPIGSVVKIFYENYLSSNGYFTAYQTEVKNQIIYSKDEYEKKEKLAGRFIALPGSMIMLIIIFYQIRKRYRVNTNAL